MAKSIKISINKDTLVEGKTFSSLFTLAKYIKKNNLYYLLFEKYVKDKFYCDHCGKQIEQDTVKFKIMKEEIILYSVDDKIICSVSCKLSLNNFKRYKNNPNLHKQITTKSGNTQRGRKLDDVWGKETAERFKKKLSKRMSTNNIQWSLKYNTKDDIKRKKENLAKRNSERTLNKTHEEIYGKKKANEISKKLSKARIGEKNPMFGRPPSKLAGNGISGNLNHLFFRSLLELAFLLDNYENIKNIKNAEKKEFFIKYLFEHKTLTYRPDFYFQDIDIIFEVKPYQLVDLGKVKAKLEYAKKQYGDRFKVKTSKEISKIKKHKELIKMLLKNKNLSFHEKKKQRAFNAIGI